MADRLVVWGRPLPPGPDRDRWMDCVMRLVELSHENGNYASAHYVFAKKVLREPASEAAPIAVTFAHVPLTRRAMEMIAADWWEPTRRRSYAT